MSKRSRDDIRNHSAQRPVTVDIVPDSNAYPTRSREGIRNANTRSQGVLGVTPYAVNASATQVLYPNRHRTKTQQNDGPHPPPHKVMIGLIAAHGLLFGMHFIGAIWAIAATFKRSASFYEMRYKKEALDTYSCAFENYIESDTTCADGTRICGRSDFDTSIDPQTLLRSDTFHMKFFDMDFDSSGVTQVALVLIESIASVFHLIYAVTFLRIFLQLPNVHVFTWCAQHGGIPSRWIEYSLTASLTCVFVANSANVFDAHMLLAILLGTYALMYFGLLIEKTLAQGSVTRALQLVYIPVSALVCLSAIPTARQLWLHLATLSCKKPSAFSLFCEKSCFGEEAPVSLFVAVAALLLALFPQVLLFKIYYIGGDASVWGGAAYTILRKSLFVDSVGAWVVPIFHITNGLVQIVIYLTYVCIWGVGKALVRVFADILWPVLPSVFLEERPVDISQSRLTTGILIGEMMHLSLSAAIRFFVLIFYVMFLSENAW